MGIEGSESGGGRCMVVDLEKVPEGALWDLIVIIEHFGGLSEGEAVVFARSC